MQLRDTEDEASVSIYQEPSKSLSIEAGQVQRSHLTSFEERQLDVFNYAANTILSGVLNGLGIDWQYTDSTATTEIPGELEINVRDEYEDGQYQRTFYNGSLGGNPFLYRFVDMEDKVENWGVNANKVFYFGSGDLELSGGGYFVTKTRDYRTDFFNYVCANTTS